MVKSEEINENPDDDASEEDKKLPAKRKRTLSAKAAVNNSIEDSDSEYKDEPPAKKQRKVKAKKVGRGRQNNLKNGTRSSKALPLDAMGIVMAFLSPRAMLNFSNTCKSLREIVTTRMVVDSALVHGGFARRSIEELQKFMVDKSLHVPSPLRLLRICNGKMCEICLCNKTNHVRPGTGLFACWTCVSDRGLTKPFKRDWARYRHNRAKYDAVFDHSRVGYADYSRKLYFVNRRLTDAAGERIGQLVTFSDVDSMVDYKGGVDGYLADELSAPPVASYEEFNNSYNESLDRATRVIAEREVAKKAKAANNKQAKILKVKKMIDDLTALVDERHRDSIMACSANPAFRQEHAKVTKTAAFKMSIPFIDDLLSPYIINPSKMKVKIRRELAASINAKLQMLVDKQILSVDFLDDSHPYKTFLKERTPASVQLLLQAISVSKEWRFANPYQRLPTNMFPGTLSTKFIVGVENDKLISALGLWVGDFSPVLMTTEPTASLVAAFKSKFDGDFLEKFGRTVWESVVSGGSYYWASSLNDKTDAFFLDTLEKAHAAFGERLPLFDQYESYIKTKHEDSSDERLDEMIAFLVKPSAFQTMNSIGRMKKRENEDEDMGTFFAELESDGLRRWELKIRREQANV
mmetsp:Transcript_31587/g.70721  ORF Transcript_31587/g.70721 Transcript_31587/m.70721 type:complete len:635 (-) Transcript_31587:3277-5181(-)